MTESCLTNGCQRLEILGPDNGLMVCGPFRCADEIHGGIGKMKPMKYAVVIERGPTSYGAHVPDLPGCAAVGQTEAEVRTLIREAIEAHLEQLRKVGARVPDAVTTVEYVEAGR